MTSTPGDRLRNALRRLRGTSRRLTLATVLVLAGGLIAGVAGIASGAGGNHAVRVNLAYACAFPSATYQVSAMLAATFPASATTGIPIQPAGLQVTVTLPPNAVRYLRSLGVSRVTTAGSLAAVATSHGTPVPSAWPVRTSAATALPATGSLTLDTSGTAPPAAASAPGPLTFAAAGLALTLVPTSASGAAPSPATIRTSCTSDARSVHLATVSVTAAGAAAGNSPRPSPASAGNQSATQLARHRSRIPKGCGHIPVIGSGQAVCGYITGYSDVRKLYGAARFGPVLVNIDFAYKHKIGHGKLTAYSTGVLYDNGKAQFPPFRSTFLGFGFVPVTATLTLVERGPINIVSVSGITAPPYPLTVTATTKVSIHISGVEVNGVPLAVGAGCRASSPARLTFVGHGENTFPPVGYTVPTGGPLSGTLTIPPFVHCGVTENLDPLLTGSISGPGNFGKITQGPLCGPSQPAVWTCPPPKPRPIR